MTRRRYPGLTRQRPLRASFAFDSESGNSAEAPIPTEGHFKAVRLRDGIIHWFSPAEAHLGYVGRKGLTPEQVESGGYLYNGEYIVSQQSEVRRWLRLHARDI